MPRPRKPSTKPVDVQGGAVRRYERADRGGVIYREVWCAKSRAPSA